MPERSTKPLLLALLVVALVFTYAYFNSTPKEFPLSQVVTIASGESLGGVAKMLYESGVIKSPLSFRLHVILQGGSKKIMAGDYLLDRREGTASLSYRMVHGNFHLETKKITIPEGWNIFQIGDYLEKTLMNFSKKDFLNLAKKKEGYLFPDTYFVSPAIKPAKLIELMNKTFYDKTGGIPGLSTSTRKTADIINMASILEEEARTEVNRRIVAGILWKRISLGIPLQVDATFSYINGKTTHDLTLDDLKIDSPYNTYLYKGLPPTPISNPGVETIMDALNPTKTDYLYFLTSKSGVMYYAKTFDEHKKNKELYLNK